MAGRPRLLLVPGFSELEWVIRPQLEEWAEVASFDAPGVGEEPRTASLDMQSIADRIAAEVDRRGWGSCVVAADEYALIPAVKFAAARPDAIDGLALGHACISFEASGEAPSVNAEVKAAFAAVAEADNRTFMRHLTQITQGFYGEELADRMIERVPAEVVQAYTRDSLSDSGEWIQDALREIGAPLLLAEHDPCLLFTKEGFRAATEAFPEAMTVTCREKPTVSPDFAEALRAFCLEAVPSG
jgi:hypothetical protein